MSRYKERRRRETENRLSDTRENLTRVEDILRDWAASSTSWRPRPRWARKYRELQADGEKAVCAVAR